MLPHPDDTTQAVDPHHDSVECKPLCRELAVPSPLGRDTPPAVRCPHCGAASGVACFVPGRWTRRHQRPLVRFGRFHPCRLELIA
jgi:hypothetical protein